MKQLVKFCGYCQKQLERKRFNGRLEDFGTFSRRKYCDRLCYAKGKIQEDVGKSALLKRASKFRKKNCQQCNATKHLQIHHLDEDIRNNSPENLTTFCASCHAKWHWSHGKKALVKSSRICSVCGKAGRTRHGMCQGHYQRVKKYGNPHLTKKLVSGSWVLVKDISTGRNHARPAQ